MARTLDGRLEASASPTLGEPNAPPPAPAASSNEVSEQPVAQPLVTAADATAALQETVYWQSIMHSTNPSDIEAFLVRFPNGTFAGLARDRLTALREAVATPPVSGNEVSEQPVAQPLAAADGTLEALLSAAVYWLVITEGGSSVDVEGELREQLREELAESITDSTNPADIEAFLVRFPNGTLAELARNRLTALQEAVVAPPSVDPPRRDGETFRDCVSCPEMVLLPEGTYQMGCGSERNCEAAALPVHDVRLPSFALSKYEVTFDEYDRFTDATGRPPADDEGWGPRPPPGDRGLVGGCGCIRKLAVRGNR